MVSVGFSILCCTLVFLVIKLVYESFLTANDTLSWYSLARCNEPEAIGSGSEIFCNSGDVRKGSGSITLEYIFVTGDILCDDFIQWTTI